VCDAGGVPPLTGIRAFDLGTCDGVRPTFADVEAMNGPVLYAAAAEDNADAAAPPAVFEAKLHESWPFVG